jgi:hypothetical protein
MKMGYDLKPRKKAAGPFHMGAFSWSWMLNAGVGLPLGYGEGYKPAMYVYRLRPDGGDVSCNDGARVSAKEAKQMAMVARWIAEYQDILHGQFEQNTEEEKERMRRNNDSLQLYKFPVRRDFVEKARAFAEWAEKSGGFRVY